MIKSITIQNFQSHKNTYIEFDDGINAIVGLSDSGKSAVIRAFNWVINNKPSGDAIRSYWGGDTLVSIQFEDGSIISRGRTNTDNYYALETPGEDRREFRAFKDKVPAEVATVLNFDEANLAFQHDMPFLLNTSSGEVAQILNAYVNLDIIDTAAAGVRKRKMEVDRKLKSSEEQVQELQQALQAFDHLEEVEKEVEYLEMLQASNLKQTQIARQLASVVRDLRRNEEEFKTIRQVAGFESMAKEGFEKLEEVKTKTKQLDTLDEVLRNISLAIAQKAKFDAILECESEVLSTLEHYQKIELKLRRSEGLTDILSHLTSTLKKQRSVQAELEEVQATFKERMPDICPLCESEVRH